MEKIQVSLESDTLNEHQHTVMIISRSFLLEMRNVTEKFVEKFRTHILCSVTFSTQIVPYMN
jgi:hypothetical protein